MAFAPDQPHETATAAVPSSRRRIGSRSALPRFEIGLDSRRPAWLPSAPAWRITGILFLIGVEAILYGFTYPFFSLALEKFGLSNWLIGLNASLAGAGILIIGPFLPRLISLLGLRELVASLFLISLISFGAIMVTESISVWFLSRFVMGACFAALWSTTEIWLNGTVDNRHRGRIIGASATLYAGAQFLGPLTLSATGVTGMLPLLAAMLPLAVAVVVALSIRTPPGQSEKTSPGKPEGLMLAIALAGSLVTMSFLAGVLETSMQSLLPLFGLAQGMSDAGASQIVAIFSLGEAVLVALLGFMADRLGRDKTLKLCAIPSLLVMIALPVSIVQVAVLWPVLFLAGGVISGVYTLGVIQIGQDFRGQRLVIVSTGFAMAYAAGAVVGSTPIGLAIDLFGANALPILVSSGFFALTIAIVLHARKNSAAKITAETVKSASSRHATAQSSRVQGWQVEADAPLPAIDIGEIHDILEDEAAFASVYLDDPGSHLLSNLSPQTENHMHRPAATAVGQKREAAGISLQPEDDLENKFRERAAEIADAVAARVKRRDEGQGPPAPSGSPNRRSRRLGRAA